MTGLLISATSAQPCRDCGDQSHKIQCDTQGFGLKPTSFVGNNWTCVTANLSNLGAQMNGSLPFNITNGYSNNTSMMYLNCSSAMLNSPLNCSAPSLCDTYINGPAVTGNIPICCRFRASEALYTIRVRDSGCQAYTNRSFDPNLPVARLQQVEAGLEVQWVSSSQEPVCGTQEDCGQSRRVDPTQQRMGCAGVTVARVSAGTQSTNFVQERT